MSATWWSQPVAAEGSIASEGIRRQLGKPRLDPLTVLIRETAQNTCDAALPDTHEVRFDVRLRHLSGNRLDAWRQFLLPEPDGSSLGLTEAMTSEPLMMTISDRGTTGLGGPLRADVTPLDGERPDFVNFVRNVGEPKHVDLGGGSYGFGKGILYNISRCHVVIADSVCVFRGRRQRRLIGSALGDGYTHGGRRWTGRHWLGVSEEGHAQPLLDAAADEMAGRLGLPRFEPGETGTTVAVVAADLGRQQEGEKDLRRDADDAAEYLVSTMLWNLWPRMLPDRPQRLVCTMKRDGFETPVPDPTQLVELAPFVTAYQNLSDGGRYEVPPRARAPREVGRFALVSGMAPVRPNRLVSAAAPFDLRAHHCARMRHADLIVDYLAGEAATDEMIQYGAVFRASAEADGFFADAEPPTHDDWVLSGLQGTARGVVQLANSFIRDQLRKRTSEAPKPSSESDTPLGSLASRLSGLMAGAEADSAVASRPRGGGGGDGGGGSGTTPRFVEGPSLVDEDGEPMLRAVVQVPPRNTPQRVVVRPMIVLDNGVEDPEDGPDAPKVIEWRSTESAVTVTGAGLILDSAADDRWEVLVRPAVDAVVRLLLETEPVGASE